MALQRDRRFSRRRRRSTPSAPASPRAPATIDSRVPHASRIYDYLLGGTTNFAVDQELAHQVFSDVYADGIESARADVRANREFLGRAVRYLAGEVGIRQFLDVGTGIPTEDNVHQVAQRVAPASRIVYVDYDLIVQAHAQLLLDSTPEGATAYLLADLREPEKILQAAATTLDFTQPIALVLVGLLHVIPDEDDAYGVVARLLAAMPSGSYLVVSHLASDINPAEMAEATRRLNARTWETFALRDHAGVARFFEGLEMVGPGLVPVDQWGEQGRAETRRAATAKRPTPIYGAVGRKP